MWPGNRIQWYLYLTNVMYVISIWQVWQNEEKHFGLMRGEAYKGSNKYWKKIILFILPALPAAKFSIRVIFPTRCMRSLRSLRLKLCSAWIKSGMKQNLIDLTVRAPIKIWILAGTDGSCWAEPRDNETNLCYCFSSQPFQL